MRFSSSPFPLINHNEQLIVDPAGNTKKATAYGDVKLGEGFHCESRKYVDDVIESLEHNDRLLKNYPSKRQIIT